MALFEKEETKRWVDCPHCEDTILVPPELDKNVQAAVLWLQLAQGDQPYNTPLIPPDAFKHALLYRYIGIHNNR